MLYSKTVKLSESQFSITKLNTTATSQNHLENSVSYKVLQKHGTTDISKERSQMSLVPRDGV